MRLGVVVRSHGLAALKSDMESANDPMMKFSNEDSEKLAPAVATLEATTYDRLLRTAPERLTQFLLTASLGIPQGSVFDPCETTS